MQSLDAETLDTAVSSVDAMSDRRRAEPPRLVVLGLFVVLAVVLAFPSVGRFASSVPGNSGDSILNLWIIRHAQIALPHGWYALWNAPIFSPAPSTYAYSDTLLPVALVGWPLRTLLGDVIAFNLVYLASWVVASWSTYRFAQRYVSHSAAAIIGAVAFTYSTVRLAHHGHFQLVVGGAVVPLVLLVLVRLLDAPTWPRAIGLGFAFATVASCASYYGAMTAVMIVVIVAGHFVAARRWPCRAQVGALAASAAIVAVCVGPIALEYLRLENDAHFRRSFEAQHAAHGGDFLAAADGNYVLTHLPVIGARSAPARGVENRLFPGALTLALGAVGATVTLRALRRRDRRARELTVLVVAGAVATVLAFGDWIVVAGQRVWLPFAVFRHVVPGFAGIRAESRLWLGGALALALVAAVGLDRILMHRTRSSRVVIACVVFAFVVAESATTIQFVQVPTSGDDGGVDTALRRLPHGVVVELPMPYTGTDWAYVEAARQLAATHDPDTRVNGYSGFQPAGYVAQAQLLNRFPAREAVARARALGVRYIVLRTHLVGPSTPADVGDHLQTDGVGRYRDDTARRMIAELQPTDVARVTALRGGYLVELR
jgi:hypothetical protein